MDSKEYNDAGSKYDLPFGAQYLVEPASLIMSPVEDWKWKSQNSEIERILRISGSLSGTTGTGPTIREDERRDEM
jgi:hypothetical protein